MRKTIIAAAVIAGTLAATPIAANAAFAPTTRATWAVYTTLNRTHQTIRVQWPYFTLTSAQQAAVIDQHRLNIQCAAAPAVCSTATVRQITR